MLEWLSQPLGQPWALYWLNGAEDYLREQVQRKLRREVLDEGFAEFNHQVLRLSASSKPATILDALSELPMMTDRRLLELQNVHELPAKMADELSKMLQREALHPGLIVVLVGDTPKTKSGLWDYLRHKAQVLTCDLEARQRGDFVAYCCARQKLELTPQQRQVVAERTAGSLRLITSAIERLALFAGESGQVSQAELDQLVHDSAEVQTWKLTAAIGEANTRKAYALLERLLKQEAAQSLLSYLNSYLLGLVQVLQLRPRFKTAAAIAKELPRRSEFQIKKSLEELGSWNETDLGNAFERLARADFRMKTGSDPLLVMQLLILQLCHRSGARR
ncbi:MAG: DNA polymerase III subunit delta [Candidatus Eremiobacteraeota bacterium]|nr:DNA polymerase III subunit delta [Candidatus Eremiobacteraeota bacterium]